MPNMEVEYHNEIANHGATVITHIGLVDESGNEIDYEEYERQPVTWENAVDGVIQPTEDLTFNVPGGTTIAGWRGYDDLTAGTNYGGKSVTDETPQEDAQYVLLAEETGIQHTTPGE